MAMRIPATNYGWDRKDPGVTEAEFDRGKSVREGVNGCDRFDSNFENTERVQVLAPRGDARGRPMPRDARFRTADNHGEWGSDTFRESMDFGLDGPDSNHSYHGAGLPTRQDLSYPATNGISVTEVGVPPTAEGIDGDG